MQGEETNRKDATEVQAQGCAGESLRRQAKVTVCTKPLASKAARQPVRAINEDDDGYDPYSDFHDQADHGPLFERDPWN